MMKKMATYQTVTALDPIPDADKIEVASIKGWKCVVKKDQFKVGDKIIYIPIDSLLERRKWNDFLADKNKPEKPIRIKTMRFRGQYSQGLVLAPKDVLGSSVSEDDLDVALGVTKYEKPIPACLAGVMKGDFPTHLISKTDEELLQNIPEILEKFNDEDNDYVITIKYDGLSGTFGIDENGEFFVCSRNMMLKETETNTFWKLARSYDIENKLRELMNLLNYVSIIIQGEVYGEGIQKNPLGIKGHDLAVFNMGVYRTKESFGLKRNISDWYFMKACLDSIGIPTVSHITSIEKPLTVEKLQEVANDLKYPNGNIGEGIVVRLLEDPTTSFKVINQAYKD
jgi:RNA ligase (TIGR02306 family)